MNSLTLTKNSASIFSKLAVFSFLLISTAKTNAQQEWTWVNGNEPANWGTKGVASPTNQISPRNEYGACKDPAGNVWIFGGAGGDVNGNSGFLNDLWKYNPSSNEWTWVSGSRTEGRIQ